MRTYTHNLNTLGTLAGLGFLTHKGNTAKTAAKGKTTLTKRAKNVALFLAAPFIGLVYLLAFPVIGVALLVWYAYKAVMANKKARTIALTVAAPVIALVFITAGPIVGIGALAWAGGKALVAG